MLGDFSHIKALIFDMDGVLFLSSACHEKAFEETLAEIGIYDFSYTDIAGMRTDEAFTKILTEKGRVIDTVQHNALVHKKRKRAQELLAVYGKVVPGSADMMRELQKKYHLVLASSASAETIEIFLQKSGYGDVFEFVLDGSSVTNAKPDPEIYTLAIQKLGMEPEECVVIEDAVSGVQAAQSAAIPVIAIAEEHRHEEFAQLKPIMIVSDVTAIGPFLLP